VVSFTSVPLYRRGKSPGYSLDRSLGPQSRFGRGGEEKQSHHCPCWEVNPDRPARGVVTVLSELHSSDLVGGIIHTSADDSSCINVCHFHGTGFLMFFLI
jgi:hypothetical protein